MVKVKASADSDKTDAKNFWNSVASDFKDVPLTSVDLFCGMLFGYKGREELFSISRNTSFWDFLGMLVGRPRQSIICIYVSQKNVFKGLMRAARKLEGRGYKVTVEKKWGEEDQDGVFFYTKPKVGDDS